MESLLSLLDNARAIGLMVLGFGFLIFVHELGHFLAARAVGIKATQFAIGIGPAVGSWRKGLGFRKGSTEPEFQAKVVERIEQDDPSASVPRDKKTGVVEFEKIAPKRVDQVASDLGLGETEYRLNWLPLGGYVKMLGQEDLAPDAVSDDDRAFNRKPAWARAVVLSAGVVMNLIFGILFFVIAFMAGVEFPPAEVGGTQPESPAAVAYAVGHNNDAAYQGLKAGDQVTHVNGEPALDFLDVRVASALAGPDDVLEFTVRREGIPEPLVYRIKPVKDPASGFLAVGILQPWSNQIGKFDKYPATLSDAGIGENAQLVEVNGKPVKRFADYLDIAEASNGKALTLTFTASKAADSAPIVLTATPEPTLQVDRDARAYHLLGLATATVIDKPRPGSPAAAAGVQPGDLLARVGLQAWPTVGGMAAAVSASAGGPVHLVVMRDGALVELPPITPDHKGLIGIEMASAVESNVIARVLPGSTFADVQLNAGSRILAVNDQPVATYADLQRITRAALLTTDAKTGKLVPAENRTLQVTFERSIAGRPQFTTDVTVTEEAALSLADTGWMPPFARYFDALREPVAAGNPWGATVLGVYKTKQFMAQTYVTIVRLFQGTVEVNQLRGVVGITHEGTRITKQGWTYLMFFLGLISINLAVMNFLPIPILDGGQMVFLIIEKIKGSPLSIRVQNIATYLGLALILSLLLVTLYHDTIRLFGGT
jgi:regulator of sigma E protease